MTIHDKDKIIAAAKEADSGFTGDESFNLGTSLVGLEAIERFYAIAFAAGAASRDAEIAELVAQQCTSPFADSQPCRGIQRERDTIAELVAALNRLYVACPTTLECRHFHHSQQERHSYIEPCGPADEYLEALNQARAALAKVRKP